MRLQSVVAKLILKQGQKTINVPSLVSETIVLAANNIEYFTLSANTIKLLNTKDGIRYFRACRKHKEFREYVLDGIKEFYIFAEQGLATDNFIQKPLIQTKFSHEYIVEFAAYIHCLLQTDLFWTKIRKINTTLDSYGFSIWREAFDLDAHQLESVGLKNYPTNFNEIKLFFLSYLRGLIGTYFSNAFVGIGEFECYNAIRSICSFVVADALGAGHLITECHFAKLIVDGKEEYGVVCSKAFGLRAKDHENIFPSSSLQRELTTLNLLDAICYQKDHGTNNYNIYRNEDGQYSVCAFDNDNPMTFCVIPSPNFTYFGGVSPLIVCGIVNRPHLDGYVVEKLMNLDVDALHLDIFLNRVQIWALKKRIKKIVNAIKRTVVQQKDFLQYSNCWSTKAFISEMEGEYGKTYLKLLLSKK